MSQFFNSLVVLPKYSKTWRLTSSTSPAALKVHTKPGMVSRIRRRLCSFDRRASSARFRSSMSVFIPNHLITLPSLSKRRSGTEKKPPIHAIETAYACFNFTWFARSQNGSPVIDKSVHVVRVKGNCPAPITGLFGREAGIVEPALIEEVSGAVRTSGPRERGDGVNYKANILCQLSLFGAMPCG